MKGKDWFVLLGAVAIGVVLYQQYLNPECRWCGVALQA